jgi:CRISPR-associated endonuclease/helicase Cas3
LVEQTGDDVSKWLRELGLAKDVGLYVLMGGEVDRDWVRDPRSDAVVIGTMDMLLSRALNRGFAVTRSRWPIEFGLANNDCLWVLDEVQLMGNGLVTAVQLQGLRRDFGTFRPTHSMWMSATAAPSWLEGPDFRAPTDDEVLELGPSDLAHPDLGRRLRARKLLRRVAVDADRGWSRQVAASVLEAHRPGTRTIVVLNTVERATELYRELVRQGGPSPTLIHSRFRPPDRRDKIERLLAQPVGDGAIIVTTQVVEAGVDVSAATLWTELAPWASMIQRFGRCNRSGEFDEASVYWLDGLARSPEPYEARDLQKARDILKDLEGRSVGPVDLEALPRGDPPLSRHVLRRRDLIDLFDTEPDLSGNDVDVSRFIRDDADVDCHLFWRGMDAEAPARDSARPHRDEICPVPVYRVRDFLRRLPPRSAFSWDHLMRQWQPAAPDGIRPGMLVLVASQAGGYDPGLGFDPSARSSVVEIALPGEVWPPEAFDSEEKDEADGGWVTLAQHAEDAARVAREFADALLGESAVEPWLLTALVAAARWHDLGKLHPVFQSALLAPLNEEERVKLAATKWAKSGAGATEYERPHFRHELATALMLLEGARIQGPALWGMTDEAPAEALDLVAYLAAAHHGKIRLAVRSLPGERPVGTATGEVAVVARGIVDGDLVPAATVGDVSLPELRLDLGIMAIGTSPDGRLSWLDRTLRLRDRFGPFKLAFLEALVRLADWEASAHPGSSNGVRVDA